MRLYHSLRPHPRIGAGREVRMVLHEPIVNGFRFAEGRAFWEGRGRVVPEAADGLKALAQDHLRWLDGLMGGRTFVCGDRFTLADVLLHVNLDFAAMVGQPCDPSLSWLAGWTERVAARESARASVATA